MDTGPRIKKSQKPAEPEKPRCYNPGSTWVPPPPPGVPYCSQAAGQKLCCQALLLNFAPIAFGAMHIAHELSNAACKLRLVIAPYLHTVISPLHISPHICEYDGAFFSAAFVSMHMSNHQSIHIMYHLMIKYLGSNLSTDFLST